MTREEYQAWKTKTNRAGEIIGRIELLERAKDQQQLDWNISSGFECHATAKEIISKDDLQNLFTLGIDTLIHQLEQELADITVGKVDAATERRDMEPWAIPGAGVFYPESNSASVVGTLADRVSESLEPLIAGGVHP
jgi:hypothetical protein